MESFLIQFQEFWAQFREPIVILVAWLLGGLIVDKIISALIKSRADKSHSEVTRAFARASSGLAAWMAGVIGFFHAWRHINVAGTVDETVSKYMSAIAILVVTAFISRLTARLIRAYSRRQDTRLPSSSIFTNLSTTIVWLIGFGFVLVAIGVDITPVITAFGIGGVAVGLALQPTLDNLFSGLQILASGQIMPEDFIRLDTGEEGFVEDVTWRNTTVRAMTGELIIVPNSILSKNYLTNFSRSNRPYLLLIQVTVTGSHDFDAIKRIALEVATETIAVSPYTYKTAEAGVNLSEITLDGVLVTIKIPVLSYPEQYSPRTYFVQKFYERLEEEGITTQAKSLRAHVS